MKYSSTLGKKLEYMYSIWGNYFLKILSFLNNLFHYIVSHATPFWSHLCYILLLSLVGYLALEVSTPRTNYALNNLDLLFTSVSATTVSSMATLEMEVFSNDQLIVITILMFLGSEVFTSMLGLLLRRYKFSLNQNKSQSFCTTNSSSSQQSFWRHWDNNVAHASPVPEQTIIELTVTMPREHSKLENNDDKFTLPTMFFASGDHDEGSLRYNSVKSLGYVVLGYLIVAHVVGSSLVSTYISLTPSANNVLRTKGLVLQTFSIFTTVSTFTNCGFIPTNENMIIFRKNSGLLLILLPQIFLGNTLFPACLRFVLWVLERFSKKKEYTYILNNYKNLGYAHLVSSKESWFLVGTVFVFLVLQFVLFCIMEWSSGVMEGMSSMEKIVGSLFQTANSRHSGEAIVDLSAVSRAILVLFVVMMYLPPYTSFLPIGHQRQEEPENNESSKKQKTSNISENMPFSQLAYLVIFVMVVCITERKSLKEDPLNFNVLNIVFEVISAYGSVGFSTGYSCERRLKLDEICEDKMYGLAGKWSKGGKLTLILVMLVGRLKKFNMQGGKAWKIY